MTAKHCETCTCSARSAAVEQMTDRLDELTAWLRSHGGYATRRTMLRHAALGVRDAAELDALIRAYETAHPGSVSVERTGARGPAATVVHAPTPS